MKKYYAESELIINPDGSIFHLHIKPEQLANKIILVGDPGRVALVASPFSLPLNHAFVHHLIPDLSGNTLTIRGISKL